MFIFLMLPMRSIWEIWYSNMTSWKKTLWSEIVKHFQLQYTKQFRFLGQFPVLAQNNQFLWRNESWLLEKKRKIYCFSEKFPSLHSYKFNILVWWCFLERAPWHNLRGKQLFSRKTPAGSIVWVKR